jgi:hypothetical protein
MDADANGVGGAARVVVTSVSGLYFTKLDPTTRYSSPPTAVMSAVPAPSGLGIVDQVSEAMS